MNNTESDTRTTADALSSELTGPQVRRSPHPRRPRAGQQTGKRRRASRRRLCWKRWIHVNGSAGRICAIGTAGKESSHTGIRPGRTIQSTIRPIQPIVSATGRTAIPATTRATGIWRRTISRRRRRRWRSIRSTRALSSIVLFGGAGSSSLGRMDEDTRAFEFARRSEPCNDTQLLHYVSERGVGDRPFCCCSGMIFHRHQFNNDSFSISSCSSVLLTFLNACDTRTGAAEAPVAVATLKGLSMARTRWARSLMCRSRLSALSSFNASSSCNRYSRFSPLGPTLWLMVTATSCGCNAPRNCGLSGIPI